MTKKAMTTRVDNHMPITVSGEMRREANNRGGYAAELLTKGAELIDRLEGGQPDEQVKEQTAFEMVGEFHETFGHPALKTPTVPNESRLRLRLSLISEEFGELIEAMVGTSKQAKVVTQMAENLMSAIAKLKEGDFDVDLVEAADALTDISVVTNGSGHELGLNLDATMKEVHASNMSKLGADGKPIYNEAGKIMKGPSYFKPDLAKIVKAQGEGAGI